MVLFFFVFFFFFENYVLFGGFAEDLSLGGSLSDSSEGLP